MSEGAWIGVFLLMNAVIIGGFWFIHRDKSKKMITVTRTICSKHGRVPTYEINVENKLYPACWHCVGEFASRNCTTETVEEER